MLTYVTFNTNLKKYKTPNITWSMRLEIYLTQLNTKTKNECILTFDNNDQINKLPFKTLVLYKSPDLHLFSSTDVNLK